MVLEAAWVRALNPLSRLRMVGPQVPIHVHVVALEDFVVLPSCDLHPLEGELGALCWWEVQSRMVWSCLHSPSLVKPPGP
jgi:hypothetical protein